MLNKIIVLKELNTEFKKKIKIRINFNCFYMYYAPQVRTARYCNRFFCRLMVDFKLLNNSYIHNLTTLTCSMFKAVSWCTVLLALQHFNSPLTFWHTLEIYRCYSVIYVTWTGGVSTSMLSTLRIPVFSYKIIKLGKILNMGGISN